MSGKNLVICDSEFLYANKLMENILERKELALKIFICTSWEKLEALAKEQRIHILIVEEGMVPEHRESVGEEQQFRLTRQASSFADEKDNRIYKYQSADVILEQVFEAYYEQTQEGLFKGAKRYAPRLIAVYSPVHRAGKTTFALALGKELAKQQKTLYLNLEEYAGFGLHFQWEAGKNLGDALYYARQEEMNFQMHLHSVIQKMEDLDYITPMLCNQDLKEIEWPEWQKFLQQIAEHSVYDAILLDLGESIRGLFDLLMQCDVVYMPILEDETSKTKLWQYEENLKQLQLCELNLKTKRILVPQKVEPYVRNLLREEARGGESGRLT